MTRPTQMVRPCLWVPSSWLGRLCRWYIQRYSQGTGIDGYHYWLGFDCKWSTQGNHHSHGVCQYGRHFGNLDDGSRYPLLADLCCLVQDEGLSFKSIRTPMETTSDSTNGIKGKRNNVRRAQEAVVGLDGVVICPPDDGPDRHHSIHLIQLDFDP